MPARVRLSLLCQSMHAAIRQRDAAPGLTSRRRPRRPSSFPPRHHTSHARSQTPPRSIVERFPRGTFTRAFRHLDVPHGDSTRGTRKRLRPRAPDPRATQEQAAAHFIRPLGPVPIGQRSSAVYPALPDSQDPEKSPRIRVPGSELLVQRAVQSRASLGVVDWRGLRSRGRRANESAPQLPTPPPPFCARGRPPGSPGPASSSQTRGSVQKIMDPRSGYGPIGISPGALWYRASLAVGLPLVSRALFAHSPDPGSACPRTRSLRKRADEPTCEPSQPVTTDLPRLVSSRPGRRIRGGSRVRSPAA